MPSLLVIVLSIAACAAAPAKRPGQKAASPSKAAIAAAMVDAQVESSGGMVKMTDRATGAVLISPAGLPVWSPDEGKAPPPGQGPAAVEIVPRDGGFDAIVTIVNNTNAPLSPGRIAISGIRFGREVVSRDFRFDGKEITIDHLNRPYAPGGWFYPDGLYSPVAIVGEGQYRIGASLHYPILDYKHQTRIGVFARRENPGRALVWELSFNLNAPGSNGRKFSQDGNLAPGEQRTYTVCVRAVKEPDAWELVFRPYAEYFKERYGPVRYERDARPVQAFSFSSSGQIAKGNPMGFRQEKMRPDVNGYGPWADHILRFAGMGWKRSMVWGAAGAAPKGEEKNIPFKFASQWRTGPGSLPRMRDFSQALPRVGRSGANLGLWWSRSALVATDWDPPTFVELDPDNPDHVSAAFADLDAAVAAGAQTIGLDAYRMMDIWKAYPWMLRLQERAPGVKFVIEPPLGDIMHTLAPCFLVATRTGEGDLRLDTRHYLADMLNPGHETWGFTRLDRLANFLKREVASNDVVAEMQRVAGLGYIPVASTGVPVDARLQAVESWKTLPPPSADPTRGMTLSKQRGKKTADDDAFELE